LAYAETMVDDMDGNTVVQKTAAETCPTPCFGTCRCTLDVIGATNFVADATDPELESWELDMDGDGLVTMTFTETVDIATVVTEEFMLQWKVADTTQSVALTGSNVVADGHIILKFTPTKSVLDDIKLARGLAISQGTSYLSISTAGLKDMTGNPIVEVPTTGAMNVKARCAFFGRNLHSRMPLDPRPLLLRLKLLHACEQWHSSRVFTPLTS
jgi:hypothetical protein